MPTSATDKLPTRIVLAKTYRMPSENENAEEWAVPLWRFIHAIVPFQVEMSVLRQDDLVGIIHERFVNYVYSRLVVGACFALRTLRTDGGEAYYFPLQDAHLGQEELRELREERAIHAAVEAVLDLSAEPQGRIVWFLTRICRRILRSGADPTRSQKRSIRRHATEEGHRCYLCGCHLHYDGRPFGEDTDEKIKEKREARAFEIEHMWSQGRGGSRARSNLAACCHNCNSLKKHLISFVDAPIEQIMTVATGQKEVQTDIPKMARLPVYWRQRGCCELCEIKFHNTDTEALYLVRKERDQPYHFFNLMAVCATCNAEHSLEGVPLRA